MAPIILSRANVLNILNWKDAVEAIEAALLSVTEKRAVQSLKSVINIPGTTDIFKSMSGYLKDEKYHALGCKLITRFPNNSKYNLPNSLGNIFLFNEENGSLEAVVDGTEITHWRTAAASAVATKYMRTSNAKNDVLAIIGAGAQARIHAIAFREIFKFNEVHIWNRNHERAIKLCDELNSHGKESGRFIAFETVEECLKGADVLITTTFCRVPLMKHEWLRKGVHINAVGEYELDEKTYKSSVIFVDSLAVVQERGHLKEIGVSFRGEVGALINGTLAVPSSGEITIFQSTGMAVEDCAMARLVYDKYKGLNVTDLATE